MQSLARLARGRSRYRRQPLEVAAEAQGLGYPAPGRPGLIELVDPYLDEIRATIPEGGVADLKLIVRLLAEKGVTIGIGGLRASLHARDVPLPTVPTVAFSSEVEVDVRSWISVYPPPSLKELCKRIEDKHGVRMSPHRSRHG